MAEIEEPEAPGRPKHGSASGGAVAFSLKALATTVGGAVLTFGIYLAETAYSNHLETIRRHDAQGIEFQAQILDLTGRIEGELTEIDHSLRRANDRDPATREQNLRDAVRIYDNLAPLYAQWRRDRLLLRNRGSQIYGPEIGDITYSVFDEAIEPNNCGVTLLSGSTHILPPGAGCLMQRREEYYYLNRVVTRINETRSLALFNSDPRLPKTFQANAAIARDVIHRYLICMSAQPNHPSPPNCEEPPVFLQIVGLRVTLVGLARANLADAIRTASALR